MANRCENKAFWPSAEFLLQLHLLARTIWVQTSSRCYLLTIRLFFCRHVPRTNNKAENITNGSELLSRLLSIDFLKWLWTSFSLRLPDNRALHCAYLLNKVFIAVVSVHSLQSCLCRCWIQQSWAENNNVSLTVTRTTCWPHGSQRVVNVPGSVQSGREWRWMFHKSQREPSTMPLVCRCLNQIKCEFSLSDA